MKLAILLALIPTLALAGKPKDPAPQPVPQPAPATSIAASQADASAEAAAIAKLQAELRQSQHQAQQQRQHANAEATGGQGVGQVDTSYSSQYDAKALSIALAAIQAAPPVGGDCREHKRGGGNAAFSVTGSTKLLQDCLARQHCLAVADRLAGYGFPQAAARQLATCGGVPVDPVEVTPAKPAEDLATKAYVQETVDRAFRVAVGK